MWSICPNRDDCFTNIPLPQLNNRMCVSWPYSQPSVVLLMCIPNFDKAVTRVLNCLSIYMEKIILLFSRKRVTSAQTGQTTNTMKCFIPMMTSDSYVYISNVLKMSSFSGSGTIVWSRHDYNAYRMVTVIMTFIVLWHFLITRKLYQSKTYNHITILSIHLRVGKKRVCG